MQANAHKYASPNRGRNPFAETPLFPPEKFSASGERKLRSPADLPENEFLSDRDFAIGPMAPGAPDQQPPMADYLQERFQTSRIWEIEEE